MCHFRTPCAIAGFFVIISATLIFGFSTNDCCRSLLQKSATVDKTRIVFSLPRIIFAEKAVIPLMIGWFFFVVFINIPLIFFHAFGEDPTGFCGTKKYESVLLLIYYEMTVIAVFFCGLVVTTIYYYRLSKWLKNNRSDFNSATNQYTRSLMRLMKIITLLPIITGQSHYFFWQLGKCFCLQFQHILAELWHRFILLRALLPHGWLFFVWDHFECDFWNFVEEPDRLLGLDKQLWVFSRYSHLVSGPSNGCGGPEDKTSLGAPCDPKSEGEGRKFAFVN